MKKRKSTVYVRHVCLIMLAPALIASCKGDSKDLEAIRPETPQMTEWVEPYHVMNSTMEDVKLFMTSSLPEYELNKEINKSGSSLLVYQFDSTPIGIIYSFDSTTGGLYSVVSTIHIASWDVVHEYLDSHYINLNIDSDKSIIDQMFTDDDRTILISTMKYNLDYFNVSYAKVTK